jgi:hypothetical protein
VFHAMGECVQTYACFLGPIAEAHSFSGVGQQDVARGIASLVSVGCPSEICFPTISDALVTMPTPVTIGVPNSFN